MWSSAYFSLSAACPEDCSCKWKSGKKTVECSDRGLITIPSNIDTETQVLDMCGNDLQILHRDTFQRSPLINLQKMYMRSCRLGQIDKNAFRGLSNLVEIDLSDNLLTHVPSQTFEDIPYLRNISLARNPIQKVDAFAFRLVPQLAKLDLSRCKIQSIRPKAFDNLDALDHLKLNDNELQELPTDTLEGLKRLRTVELHGNNWKCDCHLRSVKIWINESSIHVPQPLFCSGGPERLKDKSLVELDAEDFACKPSIKADVRRIEAALDSNVTIECRVESDPIATVRWYFNGHSLSNSSVYDYNQRLFIIDSENNIYDKRSKLVLQRVEENDAGDYYCVAENRAGNDEANFTLLPTTAASTLVALSGNSINVITVGLAVLILVMLVVIVLLVRKIRYASTYTSDKNIKIAQPEKNYSMETSSQRSHDSTEIKSECGKAYTVMSDLSYSRSLSDIGANHMFSNPDLISSTNIGDRVCETPLPITRPISDYHQNWPKSYSMSPPRASSMSAVPFGYDMNDQMFIPDAVSAGSESDEMFIHNHTLNDYPPDYGLPILEQNTINEQPCVKTLKVWQKGVPVFPPVYPAGSLHQHHHQFQKRQY